MLSMGGEELEYSVSRLAKLSGVSARTLRYYDEINLLKPKRINSSGYRIYGEAEVALLQQILFYRELDFNLEDIKAIVHAEDFDVTEALHQHHRHLSQQKARLERLIATVEQSLQAAKGETIMSDQAKFEAFKNNLIEENEATYGEEVRAKYGEDVVESSNAHLKNITSEQFQSHQELEKELNAKLKQATEIGDPKSLLAQEVCALHRQWLTFHWPVGFYDKEKHYNISLMYVQDDRFKAYYENVAPGAAAFLNQALAIYTGQ